MALECTNHLNYATIHGLFDAAKPVKNAACRDDHGILLKQFMVAQLILNTILH